MTKRLSQASLVPAGFAVVGAWPTDGLTTIDIRSTGSTSRCPSCGAASQRVHSRYTRHLCDLPIAGKSVTLQAQVRRFRCEAVLCDRRIFAERFDPAVLAPWARRTGRLEGLVHHLGLALGGRPGASFAKRLMLPVSNDTLLRVVRRRDSAAPPPPNVIGIDDWAWRRNHRYGTIICDLERRRPISLLPDREPATAQAWLSQQPQIAIVARDRGGAYALAAARALPHAVQVADRWHLMENASRAFLDAVRKSMRQIRSAVGAMTVNPDLLSAAERLQYEGYLRREEATRRSLPWPRTASRSRRSSAVQGTVAVWCVRSFAANAATCSASARARSKAICRGWTPSGRLGEKAVPSFGGSLGHRAFGVHFAW